MSIPNPTRSDSARDRDVKSVRSLSTSHSLLQRAVGGESTAWQRIVQLYGPLVYRWARQSGLAAEDAADVVQETMVAVSARLDQFDGQRVGATFRGWLRRIARNKSVDIMRRDERQLAARGGTANVALLNEQAEKELGQNGLSDQALESEDQRAIVKRALTIMRSGFEQTTWRAFWRTTIDGCSPGEVADELGISRWNVYKARSRVLQRLPKRVGRAGRSGVKAELIRGFELPILRGCGRPCVSNSRGHNERHE